MILWERPPAAIAVPSSLVAAISRSYKSINSMSEAKKLAAEKAIDYVEDGMIVGVGFEAQRMDKIDVEAWDVRADAICTEANTYTTTGAFA